MNSGSYLSLVGLGRENMMITANEKLLEEMNSVAKSIYDSVIEYFRKAEVREKLQNIADVLVEREVIYDLEEFFEEKAEESISLDKKDEENA